MDAITRLYVLHGLRGKRPGGSRAARCPDRRAANPYFSEFYCTLADALAGGGEALFGIESREHTAQKDRRNGRNGGSVGVKRTAKVSPRKRKSYAPPGGGANGVPASYRAFAGRI